MEQEYLIEGSRMVWRMPREVDHHSCISIIQTIEELVENRGIRTLVFDFAKTEFMDSSGIGMLIGRSRSMHFLGGEVHAVNLTGRAELLFKASGLDELIEVVKEEDHE